MSMSDSSVHNHRCPVTAVVTEQRINVNWWLRLTARVKNAGTNLCKQTNQSNVLCTRAKKNIART